MPACAHTMKATGFDGVTRCCDCGKEFRLKALTPKPQRSPSESTAEAESALREAPETFVLIKRGLYWRPNSMGYTGILSEAGLYTEEEASARTGHDSVTSMPASEAPKFSPACWEETQIKVLAAELEAAEAALTAERTAREEAEAERDAWEQVSRRNLEVSRENAGNLIIATADRDRLAEENARLRAALKPFADAAEAYERGDPDDYRRQLPDDFSIGGMGGALVTHGHMRAARALTSTKGADDAQA